MGYLRRCQYFSIFYCCTNIVSSLSGGTYLIFIFIQFRVQLSTFGEGKVNVALQKKIADSTEAAIILEGVVGFLEQPVSVFVRLNRAISLDDLPEVDIVTRYLYFFAAPPTKSNQYDEVGGPDQYADIGISLATALTDKAFVNEVRNGR